MKTALVVWTGAVACALLTIAAVRPSTPALATRVITIDARCTGPRDTQVSVRPWNAQLSQGDDAQWAINAAANTNGVSIVPKSLSWPFTNNRPNGTKTAPATGSGMKPNARGRYSYTIQLVCQSGNQAPDTIRVDPDVIVE